MFLLSIIGISVCGTMCSGELPIKGWIVGFIGILIAMVGIDPIYGVERYTFDTPGIDPHEIKTKKKCEELIG